MGSLRGPLPLNSRCPGVLQTSHEIPHAMVDRYMEADFPNLHINFVLQLHLNRWFLGFTSFLGYGSNHCTWMLG